VVTRLLPAALAAALLPACVPELPDDTAQVSGPRLLAIASIPAEAAPPAEVTYRALYVEPPGGATLRDAGLSWAYCVARKALTDEGTVSPDCFATGEGDLVPLGAGATATGALPAESCRLFGPDLPDPVMGQPAGRPVDPDPTGGYYQPVRLQVPAPAGTFAIGATRISCGLSGATAAVSEQFTQQYRANENPAIHSLKYGKGKTITPEPDAAPGASGAKLPLGASVTLSAAWVKCPTTPMCGDGICGSEETIANCPADCTNPVGCTGSEPYVVFDTETMGLSAKREAMQVAWYATAGAFTDDSTAPTADAPDTAVNTWTAPAVLPNKTGEVLLWLVVRDDRGGVGWQSYRLTVE
jgi:hypothetical protein